MVSAYAAGSGLLELLRGMLTRAIRSQGSGFASDGNGMHWIDEMRIFRLFERRWGEEKRIGKNNGAKSG